MNNKLQINDNSTNCTTNIPSLDRISTSNRKPTKAKWAGSQATTRRSVEAAPRPLDAATVVIEPKRQNGDVDQMVLEHCAMPAGCTMPSSHARTMGPTRTPTLVVRIYGQKKICLSKTPREVACFFVFLFFFLFVSSEPMHNQRLSCYLTHFEQCDSAAASALPFSDTHLTAFQVLSFEAGYEEFWHGCDGKEMGSVMRRYEKEKAHDLASCSAMEKCTRRRWRGVE